MSRCEEDERDDACSQPGGGPVPGSFRVRAALASDVTAMQAIEVDAGARFRRAGLHAVANEPPPTAELLLAHVRLGTAWVAVERAADGDIPMGYAIASVVDGEGHLDQVSVRERAEGRGVGTSLVRCVLDWSAAAGHPAVTLTTFRDLPWNGPWYRRRGFSEVTPTASTPELAAILAAERAAGLEPPLRVAMRRPADP